MKKRRLDKIGNFKFFTIGRVGKNAVECFAYRKNFLGKTFSSLIVTYSAEKKKEFAKLEKSRMYDGRLIFEKIVNFLKVILNKSGGQEKFRS